MQIVLYPHPALRWKSRPILRIDAQLRSVVREMFDLMYEAKGVGLAANQVALPWRVFVVNPAGDAEQDDAEMVFINPEITRRSGSAESEEGCLSLPDLYGPVRRPEQIVIEAFDLNAARFQLEVDELTARVIQHENDHLDGVLFLDRMSQVSRRELEPRLQDFESLFRRQQQAGVFPQDTDIERELRGLEQCEIPQ